MSEPDAERTPSLIQQRLALQRRKTWAIVLAVFWTVSAAWWLSSGLLTEMRDLDVMRVIIGAVSVMLAIAQVFTLRHVLRDVRAFEARHGTDAGRQ
ncbi:MULTISPECIES: hypothetical protein [unclassified Microbacterium]|uniref:hypothetical protein n=1 Tax=unclassified Microbacterium TaxID=2609290 RepID=UPI001604B14B|nr:MULTISPECIES: hypothetical protein [unclassified Microbacterium]QNA93218.1 hypothetical protein G4G29_14525 [Microbacterium sp. Se63.02b]QYM63426.1 hypothetical protein K1X59_14575 [Microbacterium sp. Se5.02b]